MFFALKSTVWASSVARMSLNLPSSSSSSLLSSHPGPKVLLYLSSEYLAACRQYEATLSSLRTQLNLMQSSMSTVSTYQETLQTVQTQLEEAAAQYESTLMGLEEDLARKEQQAQKIAATRAKYDAEWEQRLRESRDLAQEVQSRNWMSSVINVVQGTLVQPDGRFRFNLPVHLIFAWAFVFKKGRQSGEDFDTDPNEDIRDSR